MLHEGSNITVPFAEHLKLQEKMTFTYALWVNSDKSREKQLELEHCTFWNCYLQGAPQSEQYHSSFREAPKISRINYFYRIILGKQWGIKIKKNCYIKGAPQKMQYHCSFSGAPKISRKSDFHTFTLGQAWQNKITKTRIRALYIFSSLYTGCSTKQAISLFLLRRA